MAKNTPKNNPLAAFEEPDTGPRYHYYVWDKKANDAKEVDADGYEGNERDGLILVENSARENSVTFKNLDDVFLNRARERFRHRGFGQNADDPNIRADSGSKASPADPPESTRGETKPTTSA